MGWGSRERDKGEGINPNSVTLLFFFEKGSPVGPPSPEGAGDPGGPWGGACGRRSPVRG